MHEKSPSQRQLLALHEPKKEKEKKKTNGKMQMQMKTPETRGKRMISLKENECGRQQ